ncbi:MAG: PIG-L family deacetylase [Candidatus Omnitrophota bacterium]
MYKLAISVLYAIFLIGNSASFSFAKEIPLIEPFEDTDRVLIISPHPDDDIIGCAGVIQRALAAGAKVKVVYITCGDNNPLSIISYYDISSLIRSNKMIWLAEFILSWKERFIDLGHTRIQEAISAEKTMGLEEKDLTFLGYPDHGTDQMFIFSWDHTRPFSNSLAGHSYVPYEKGMGCDKGFTADNLIDDLKSAISDFKPTRIFVGHPSDANGDHWASYLYTMASLSDLGDTIPRPKIYAYLIHVADWPLPRNYHPHHVMTPPEKFFGDVLPLIDWHQLKLTEQEIGKKHEAILKHESQTRFSAFYLLSFVRQNELFGDFPYIVLKKQRSSELSGKDVFKADMQWFAYAVVDDSFWISVSQPKELEQGINLGFIIDGFRSDVPFAKMPSILVYIENNKFYIYNATEDRYIYPDNASLEIYQDSMIFKIPLDVLGNPQGLFFGPETTATYMPEGCTAFRVIKIE